MKNALYGFISLLIILIVVTACNKFGDIAGKNGQIVATKYKLEKNEPDSLILVGAKLTDSVKWTVVPSGFDSLVTRSNTALIIFKKAGNYLVKAVDNGGSPASVSLSVSDSLYHSVAQKTITLLKGDQITLVPHFYNSADSSYLYFVAQTRNYYCGISKLQVADSLINNNYAIRFLDVVQPSPCIIGNGPISGVINFNQNQPGQLPNGTFPIHITLNDTTYTGSIVTTPTTVNFNWNYTHGVLISPKQISR